MTAFYIAFGAASSADSDLYFFGFVISLLPLAKNGYAPSALMGADAERAHRLQERRSFVVRAG
jgi:hypothetical protein